MVAGEKTNVYLLVMLDIKGRWISSLKAVVNDITARRRSICAIVVIPADDACCSLLRTKMAAAANVVRRFLALMLGNDFGTICKSKHR